MSTNPKCDYPMRCFEFSQNFYRFPKSFSALVILRNPVYDNSGSDACRKIRLFSEYWPHFSFFCENIFYLKEEKVTLEHCSYA